MLKQFALGASFLALAASGVLAAETQPTGTAAGTSTLVASSGLYRLGGQQARRYPADPT